MKTYMAFTAEELALIAASLGPLTIQEAADVRKRCQERLDDMANPAQTDLWTQFRDAAEAIHAKEGEIEFDKDAMLVAEGEDDGAYVMAWVWVSDDDAGHETAEVAA